MATATSLSTLPEQVSTETFSIRGMHCAGCVARVESALAQVPGVVEATVNLAAETGRIAWDPSLVDPDAIAARLTDLGYPSTLVVDRAAQERERALLKEFERRWLTLKVAVSATLALAIVLLSHLELIGIAILPPLLSGWVQLVLVLPIQFWAGAEFYTGSWQALKSRSADMNVLIMIGTTAAVAFSTLALLFPGLIQFPGHHGNHVFYFESAAVIITLILTGRLLELKAKTATTAAIRALVQLQAPTAERLAPDGTFATVPVELVAVGDTLRVAPGAQVPVDGRILEGRSALDESLLTGESIPVERGPADPVIGGSLNTTGSLLITATQVGEGTLLGRIIRLVEEAQGSKAPIQRLADQIAAVFVPAVLIVAGLTAGLWLLFGDQVVHESRVMSTALTTTMAVLIIACPCALGLATPTAIMAGTGRGARLGVLIRNGTALEQLAHASIVVFDKTGTLTQGTPQLLTLHELEADALAKWGPLVLAAESPSEHPLSRALNSGLAARGIAAAKAPAEAWDSVPGAGVTARIDGHSVLLGNARLMEREGIDITPYEKQLAAISTAGQTPVWIAIDRRPQLLCGLADPLKPEARAIIQQLEREGVRPILATGDHAGVAQSIAVEAGISEVHAGLSPGEKLELITILQQSGQRVAMLGDGVNDAPALAQADVGVAMGTGAAVALETASVTLLRGELEGFVRARQLSAATLRTIRQNLFWAFAYNTLGIPLAAGLFHVLFGWPFLNPMFAAAAMALSSVTVLYNSLRLQRWNPQDLIRI